MSNLNSADRAILRRIVSRCPVSASKLEVIRYVISRLRKKYATYRAMPRGKRRELLRLVIKAHTANRRLYAYVTGGVRPRAL